jgi:2-C-methyl-D-erythritol 2,4-cyclodiphosphate synthase
MAFRIGFGYDVHRLKPNLPFKLGGVLLPSDLGMVAHSDGDVLIHAICDALLGAANLGDIGKHFPDNDDEFKNISSLVLLQRVMNLLTKEGYSIVNIDTTVVVEKPKLSLYIELMKKTIAESVFLTVDQISIKATTNEMIGFVGRNEGIAAYAIAMIEKK